MNFVNGSSLQTATIGALTAFVVGASYSLLTYLIPPLAIFGMFFAFGFVANAVVVPSGLLLLALFGTLLVIERGIKAIFGGALLALTLGICAYVAYQSITGFLSIHDRARYVAALPERTLKDHGTIRIVHVDWDSEAVCRFECMRLLLTGSIASYVISYHPDIRFHRDPRLESLRYREFYVGAGPECAAQNIVSQEDVFSPRFALYLVGSSCVLRRELATPPDGVWVLNGEFAKDKPEFEFQGQVVSIMLRENGEESLLVHQEAGKGLYPGFPPMFVAWFSSDRPRVEYDWVRFWYSYGMSEDLENLVERALGVSFAQRSFPDRLIPGILSKVSHFEAAYTDFQPSERSRIFHSIAFLLRERPDLLDELRALVLRGVEDTDTVASEAIAAFYQVGAADRDEYVPVILSRADRPALNEDIVRLIRYFGTKLSAADLLRLAKSFSHLSLRERHSVLFDLLRKSGKNGHAALTYLLSRDDYRLQEASACILIDQGQVELVRPHADVFVNHLRNHSWRGYSRKPCDAHTILRDVGLQGDAIQAITERLADPALRSSARENLQRRLDELQ